MTTSSIDSMHDYYALAGIFKSSKTMDNFKTSLARAAERPLAVPGKSWAQRDAKKAEADAVQAQIQAGANPGSCPRRQRREEPDRRVSAGR